MTIADHQVWAPENPYPIILKAVHSLVDFSNAILYLSHEKCVPIMGHNGDPSH